MDLMDARFAAFLGVTAVLIVIPGPDMALVTRNVLSGGRRAGAFTAVGVGVGVVGWAVATALGVAQLLDRSALAFYALKLFGATYLMLLGLRAIVSRRRVVDHRSIPPVNEHALSARSAICQGALGNVLNPKAGVIFVVILPQFIMPGDSIFRLVAMLVAFELMIVGWLVGYAAATSRLSQSRAGVALQRKLERVTGFVLVGLGVRLALERH